MPEAARSLAPPWGLLTAFRPSARPVPRAAPAVLPAFRRDRPTRPCAGHRDPVHGIPIDHRRCGPPSNLRIWLRAEPAATRLPSCLPLLQPPSPAGHRRPQVPSGELPRRVCRGGTADCVSADRRHDPAAVSRPAPSVSPAAVDCAPVQHPSPYRTRHSRRPSPPASCARPANGRVTISGSASASRFRRRTPPGCPRPTLQAVACFRPQPLRRPASVDRPHPPWRAR